MKDLPALLQFYSSNKSRNRSSIYELQNTFSSQLWDSTNFSLKLRHWLFRDFSALSLSHAQVRYKTGGLVTVPKDKRTLRKHKTQKKTHQETSKNISKDIKTLQKEDKPRKKAVVENQNEGSACTFAVLQLKQITGKIFCL